MSDIELVIKIPQENYEEVKGFGIPTYPSIAIAIQHGTPLPKGHKIIDATALQEHLALVPMEDRTFRETVDIIDGFPSIIEADKTESENKTN